MTALAVIDSRGRLHGYRYDTQFGSASVVKAMLLVQYLRAHPGIPRHERLLLTRMVVGSDNAATDRVFAQVGTGGLSDLAWFGPDGQQMDDARWYDASMRTIQMFVHDMVGHGCATDGDSVLVVPCGARQDTTVVLPPRPWGSSYTLLWDSADDLPRQPAEPVSGDQRVTARSLRLYAVSP